MFRAQGYLVQADIYGSSIGPVIFHGRNSMRHKVFLLFFLGAFMQLPALALDMNNALYKTGEGNSNPSYQRSIKNILIFQAGGWSGLPVEADKSPTWPLAPPAVYGGRTGYLSKTNSFYLEQMGLIKSLNKDTAIAVLVMPDEEARASGYGTCFNGIWSGGTGCSAGGAWTTPKSSLAAVKWAAWMKGIEVAPLISINLYDSPNGSSRAALVLQRLKDFVDWYMTTIDKTTLKTTSGKVVVLTEGLPENTDLQNEAAAKAALASYMNSRTDILWIDNLLLQDGNPESVGSNVYRSAATSDPTGSVQDSLNSIWGGRYLWTFLDRWGSSTARATNIPEAVRCRWLNLSSRNPKKYPVIISQWNEYAESHVFEPNEHDGYDEYRYLQRRLAQQASEQPCS